MPLNKKKIKRDFDYFNSASARKCKWKSTFYLIQSNFPLENRINYCKIYEKNTTRTFFFF